MTRPLCAFDYELPPDRIATRPARPRDSSRLLFIHRDTGEVEDGGRFRDITKFLRSGDLLVVNDSRVIPARMNARKTESGGLLELFLLSIGPGDATALLRPARRVRSGQRLTLPGDQEARVTERLDGGHFRIRHSLGNDWLAWLEEHAEMPLPPYIARQRAADAEDRRDYQTVYAGNPGSVAAPTAGLHFTKTLIDDINQMGVAFSAVTLNIGPGTFQPVSAERIEDHVMHTEDFTVHPDTVAALDACRRRGGRVIAVGTTVVRVLEHLAAAGGVRPGPGRTDIFIREGFPFRVVDGMITNFHLPRSTLLMLVAAFAGYETVMRAYRMALEGNWRFYSYGDAMFIAGKDGSA